MHIPDNYLSPSTCAVLGAAMIPIWRRAASRVKSELSRKRMPLLGIGAAFSFLIMMFNLPLPGGTTGHAVGAVLVAVLLGPWSAVISLTIALAVQALFFGDGGLLSFGANAFNMAFIMPIAGYYIYRLIKGKNESPGREYWAIFTASYIAVNLGALFAAAEFGIQPLLFRDPSGNPLYCPYSFNVSFPAMMIPHLLIVGIVEGLFTAGVYAFIKKTSPETIYNDSKPVYKPLYILIGLLAVLSPLGLIAGGTAWGEWSPEELGRHSGFVPEGIGKGFSFKSLMPDYNLTGYNTTAGYILSAVIGIVILLILFKLLNMYSNRKSRGR